MTIPFSTSKPVGRPSKEGAEFVSEEEVNSDDLPQKQDVDLPIEAQIRTSDEILKSPNSGD